MPNSLSELHVLHAWEDNQITERCTQGEFGSKILQFKLIDKDGDIDLSNCIVQYAVIRPDKTEDLLNCIVQNGVVKCNITYSVTSVSGLAHGEIRVIGNNNSGIVKFYGVNLRVYNGVSDEVIEQSDEFSALSSALLTVNGLTGVYVTPEMYGAKGDGVTDDTQYVESALNSGLPVFCSKSYLIDGISISHGNVVAFGNGKFIQKDVTQPAPSTPQRMLSVSGSSNVRIANVIFDGLSFVTNSAEFVVSDNTSGAVFISYCDNVIFRNCSITTNTNRAVCFYYCNHVSVHDFNGFNNGAIFTFYNCNYASCCNGSIVGSHPNSTLTNEGHSIDFYSKNGFNAYGNTCHDINVSHIASNAVQFTGNLIVNNPSVFTDYSVYNINAYDCDLAVKLDGIVNCVFENINAEGCRGCVAVGGGSTFGKVETVIVKNCVFKSPRAGNMLPICTLSSTADLMGDFIYENNIIENCPFAVSDNISGNITIKNNIISAKDTHLNIHKEGSCPDAVCFEANQIRISGTVPTEEGGETIQKPPLVAYPLVALKNIVFKDNYIYAPDVSVSTKLSTRLMFYTPNLISFLNNYFIYSAFPNSFRIRFPSGYTPTGTEVIKIHLGGNMIIEPGSVSNLNTLYTYKDSNPNNISDPTCYQIFEMCTKDYVNTAIATAIGGVENGTY